jgi:DNA-directed RNA polymerase specialized sigma24 family protein
MERKILQIEGIEAEELLTRLDRVESAITSLSDKPQPSKENTLSGYITRREIADLFQISLVTVHDWTRKGLLQAYKIANRVYYKQSEVEKALVKKGGIYENR